MPHSALAGDISASLPSHNEPAEGRAKLIWPVRRRSREGFDGRPISRCCLVAFAAGQDLPQDSSAAFRRDDPWPVCPGGIVAYMLVVPARQLRDPVCLFILMETDDALIHGATFLEMLLVGLAQLKDPVFVLAQEARVGPFACVGTVAVSGVDAHLVPDGGYRLPGILDHYRLVPDRAHSHVIGVARVHVSHGEFTQRLALGGRRWRTGR